MAKEGKGFIASTNFIEGVAWDETKRHGGDV